MSESILLESLIVVGLLCLVAGCSGTEAPDPNLSVLDRGLPSDPESLDPQKARSLQSAFRGENPRSWSTGVVTP